MESSWGCNGRIERIESDGVDTSYEQHLQSVGRDCDSWVGSVIKSKISKTGCYLYIMWIGTSSETGWFLNQPEITTIAKKYGVTVPQLCIRYTLQLGAISLPKTGNPEHMKSNAQLDFQISAEDMELLKNFKKIKSYGDSGIFPVYGGKM